MNTFIQKISPESRIDYINMVLMLVSAAVAFVVPFHTFLFVYAVLGPLHYLTEISWLEKRSFFIAKKWDIIFLIVTCFIISLTILSKFGEKKFGAYTSSFMFASLLFAVLAVVTKNNFIKFGLSVVLLIIAIKFKMDHIATLVIMFGILLPTLIHVYLFTGIFMFYGALKQRSWSGILALVVFIACTIFFFVYNPVSATGVSEEIMKMFDKFKVMNQTLGLFAGEGEMQGFSKVAFPNNDVIYYKPIGIAIMRFIAFAYTYHYLNWFSKTRIIKWHEISKTRMAVILLLWLISVALYAKDYDLGFKWLFLLSMLHVFLEFPLNVVSIKGVGQEIGKIMRGQKK